MNNGKAVAYQPHKQRLERAFKLQMPGGSRAGIERAVEDGSSKIERGTSFGGAPPPTPEELDRQLRTTKLQSFGKELQEIANASLSTTEASRYRNVYVLILKWEDEDPQLPVSLEISKLKDAFVDVYHFNTEVWDIPDEDCHDSVNQKILDFKRLGSDSKDDLKILYYGGHGRLTRNRSLAWSSWRSVGRSKCPTVKWSGIQNVLEEAQSDVLLLLDCCHSGISNTDEGRGITELLASCDYRSIANGVGPFSFTHALVIEFLNMARLPCFSVLELYNNIYLRIQGRMPEDGRERHPAPVHLVLTNNGILRQSIQLSIRPELPRSQPTLLADYRLSRTNYDDTKTNKATDAPILALAISFPDDLKEEELSTDQWAEWLRSMPAAAKQVRVEGGMGALAASLIIPEVSLTSTEPTGEIRTPFRMQTPTTLNNYIHPKNSRRYPISCQRNDNSTSSEHASTLTRPSVHLELPPEKHKSNSQSLTPWYHHPSALSSTPERLQTMPYSPPRILTSFNSTPDSYRPPLNFIPPPPPSFSTAVLANHIHCPSPPTHKYFPDLRSQYQPDKPVPHHISKSQKPFNKSEGHPPQEEACSHLEQIGLKVIGVSLADSFLIGPIYAIWTLGDIWSNGIKDSYDQVIGVGILFSMTGMAVMLVLHPVKRRDVCDRVSDQVFTYFVFALMILNLLAVPVWCPWILGRLFGSKL